MQSWREENPLKVSYKNSFKKYLNLKPYHLQQDSPHSAKDAIRAKNLLGGILQDFGAWRGKNCFHVVFTL